MFHLSFECAPDAAAAWLLTVRLPVQENDAPEKHFETVRNLPRSVPPLGTRIPSPWEKNP